MSKLPKDIECMSERGVDCLLTGKKLDLKKRSFQYGKNKTIQSRKYLWLKT